MGNSNQENSYNQEVITEIEPTYGDKLKNLVYRKNTKRKFDSVHHDVGVMFMYQASAGILEKLDDNTGRHYLDGYILEISTIESLFNTYSSLGNGLQFNFVFLTKQEYIRYTGDNSVLNISDLSNEFLYVVATPLDSNNAPIKEHFVIFNLNYAFDITKNILSDADFTTLLRGFLDNNLHGVISAYSTPKGVTERLRYTWDNIKEIITETNSVGEKYEKVEFILGEITRYKILSDFFRRNPQYGLDEEKYKKAYENHEKQLTVVGKYLPDDIVGKEGFFDMGSLYP